jgi:hypothetical protein
MYLGYTGPQCPSRDCISLPVHNEQPDGSVVEAYDMQ